MSLQHVGNVRNKGLMVGIELVKDRESGEPFEPGLKMGWQVADKALEDEVLIRPLGDVVVLMPPIGIPLDDPKKLLRVTYQSIKEVTESPE